MIIAHRGVHNNKNKIPENSMLSFKKAIDKKYTIELDIQLTKDEKIVIHHDDNVFRMTGVNKNIEDMTFDEVRNLRLLDTNELIPTFKEVLDLVNGKVLLDIEIKNTKRIDLVCYLVLKELANYKGEVLLKSFNPFIVKNLKKKSNYRVGILITKKSPNKALNFLVNTNLIYLFKHDFIAINKKMLSPKYYDKYIKKTKIYAWTFNGLIEAEEYLKKYPKIICICNDLD